MHTKFSNFRKTCLLLAAALLFACAAPAFADTLGNTLADKLCGGLSGNTYRLSTAQLAQWIGLGVGGSYSINSAGATTSYYFYKTSDNNDEATCKKTYKTSSGTDCRQSNVTRNMKILTKSTDSSSCN
jgi:hypothetical protein